jgi:hypothetical protein
MRGIETGRRMWKTAALLCWALALSTGTPALAGPFDPIPDAEMTAEVFDDTIAFTPDDGADAAIPPLEVHAVDEGQAAAAGATKVVDGSEWLDADDYERNDILLEVEDNMPPDTDLVIDVSTGDIWVVPLAAGVLLPPAFRPWSDEEYFRLDEYWKRQRLIWNALTRQQFAALVAVANGDAPAPRIEYLHTFGAAGYRELQSRYGFQVALSLTWLRETPEQRWLRIMMLKRYYSRLAQFQAEGNQLGFALMVPEGALFLIAYLQQRAMLAQSGIQPWTLYDMAMLPVVLTVLDRQIRGERFILDRREIP